MAELCGKDKLIYRVLRKEVVTCCVSYQPGGNKGIYEVLRPDSESADVLLKVKFLYIEREF
jgi:hypothetical protein